jgi:hypothetical protein
MQVFVEGKAQVQVARVPVGFSREAQDQADDVAELLLPKRWREVWRADNLKVVGTTQPLLPSVLQASLAVPDVLNDIDGIPARVRNRLKLARERRPSCRNK